MYDRDRPAAIPKRSFDQYAEHVLGRFRSAFAKIIEALPGQIRRPQELSRTLAIDKKLGWKICNVVQTPDPFMAAHHVLGLAGIRILLDAAKKKRIPHESIDEFVHEDLFGRIEPEPAMYSELSGETPAVGSDATRFGLPLRESVEHLGRGPTVLHTPDVPRYADMARYVFEQMGWNGRDFSVYRFRIAYPPIPAAVVMSENLPARPD